MNGYPTEFGKGRSEVSERQADGGRQGPKGSNVSSSHWSTVPCEVNLENVRSDNTERRQQRGRSRELGKILEDCVISDRRGMCMALNSSARGLAWIQRALGKIDLESTLSEKDSTLLAMVGPVFPPGAKLFCQLMIQFSLLLTYDLP